MSVSAASFARAVLPALVVLALLAAFPGVASARVGEWRHGWEVVQLVRLAPPAGTPVFYFGDSTARESTVRDARWTLQVRRRAELAGRTTALVVFTMASHDQTFGMDRQYVDALPTRAPQAPRGIAVIGVGLSRFIGPPSHRRPAAVAPPPRGRAPRLHVWVQHLYADRDPLPLVRKHELVPRWMARRWAGFARYRRANLRAVAGLIDACRAKGLRPILLELPLDLRVVGDGLDRPRGSFRSACRRLARTRDVAYLTLVPPALPTADFWDLMHLLPPGSRRWQSRLSDRLVRFLPPASPAS